MDELHHLMLGPKQYLTSFNFASKPSKSSISPQAPIDDEASFAEIANNCGISEDGTKRVLRQAMTQHIFKEPRKCYVAHTAISRQIADDPLIRDWIAFMWNEEWRAAPRFVNTMAKWPGSEEPEHTGWVLANNFTRSLTQDIFKYPERPQRLPGAM